MKQVDNSDFIKVGIATLGFVGTIVGLVADIPQLQQSLVGQISLWLIFILTLGYLSYFTYKVIIQELYRRKKQLDKLREYIVRFTSEYAGQDIRGTINHELINLILATKRMRQLNLLILELQQLSAERIKITIDKGLIHGPIDKMSFKIFHKNQMEEIGNCECTAAHNQSTLIVTKHTACNIHFENLTVENIEIRIIDPNDINIVNYLIADMLFELDFRQS